MELAAQFFEAVLKGAQGARGRDYIGSRAIAPAVRAEFRLGYAPAERYALRDALAAKGASVEVMCEAGLLNHGEGIAVPYDKFRDRVIFPIQDRSGRVIAFGGRALEKGVPAKYLNSPETPLFHKGHLLYNHHRARKPAQDSGTVIAVEGYIDVIAMTAAGFPNVVAGLGTALTIEQCELLWRMSPEPILCFDGDGAGRRAAAKALDTALPSLAPEKTLRFAFLPDGQDPDDLAKSGGEGAIAAVLGQAKPLVEVLWTRETEATTLDTPERRAGLKHRLGDLAKQIGDETLRRYYQQELYGRLDALTGGNRRGGPAGGGAWAARGGEGRGGRPASPFAPAGRPRFGTPAPLRGYRGTAPAQLSSGAARGPRCGRSRLQAARGRDPHHRDEPSRAARPSRRRLERARLRGAGTGGPAGPHGGAPLRARARPRDVQGGARRARRGRSQAARPGPGRTGAPVVDGVGGGPGGRRAELAPGHGLAPQGPGPT